MKPQALTVAIDRVGGNVADVLERRWTLIACAVMALQAALVLNHEPWFDEWQAVQIAEQSPNLKTFFVNLTYEGHPPLWYAALWLGAKIAGPYAALSATALACAMVSQYLLLFRSPFSHAIRLSIAFSAIILFEYNTISRSYTLGVMLLFCLLTIWDRRRIPWLPIALLPALEFFFGVFTLYFIARRWRDGRLWWPGVAAWLVVSILSAISIIPAADNVPGFRQVEAEALTNVVRYILHLSALVFPLGITEGRLYWDMLPPFYSAFVLWAVFGAICFVETRRMPMERTALFGFMLLQAGFYVFVTPLAIRHAMLAALLLLTIEWVKVSNGGKPRALFRGWIFINAICGLTLGIMSLFVPFDTSRSAAEFIRQNELGDAHWVAFPRTQGQGVNALTNLQFERPGHSCKQAVVRWAGVDRTPDSESFDKWVSKVSAVRGRFYVMTSDELDESDEIKRIGNIPAGYDRWIYRIYVVNPDKPLWRPDMPSCTPDLQQYFSETPEIDVSVR